MGKYFEKISVLTATVGFFFLCGTLYLIGFWTTFEFDITTYVDILDIPKSFVFPLAAALGLSALSMAYQVVIRIHPPKENTSSKKPDKLYLFLSKIPIWVYAATSFSVLSVIYFFSKDAFYTLLTFIIGIFLAKEVVKFIVASGVTNVYIRWLTLIIICFLPPGSFSIGKLESLGIYNNEDYYKVSHVEYITTNGGKLEEVDLKLIGKLGSYIFLTDSLNSKIVTINLGFVKQIEYFKIKKETKGRTASEPKIINPLPVPETKDTLNKFDSSKQKTDILQKTKAMTTTLVLPSALILINIVLTYYFSYYLEKRKNRATQESIGNITSDVEAIKNELSYKKDLKFSCKNLQRDAIVDFYEKTIIAIANLSPLLLSGIPYEDSNVPSEIRANIKESFYQFGISIERVIFYVDDAELDRVIRAFNILLIQYKSRMEKALLTHEFQKTKIKSADGKDTDKLTNYHELLMQTGNQNMEDHKNIYTVLYDLRKRFNELILNPS